MWTHIYNTNEPIYEIELNREQAGGCQGGGDWERDGVEISRCKWLYMEWINKKVILYSKKNYIEYNMLNIYTIYIEYNILNKP